MSQRKRDMRKYFWAGTSLSFYGWLAAVLLVFGVLGHFSRSEYRSYSIEFVLETEQPVNFDIYYDVGRGFNEVDHQTMIVETVDEPVTVSFCIPVWKELEELRFDPAKEHAKMKIYSITLLYDSETSFEVPLETLAPRQQIVEHDYDGTRYALETAVDGEDPIIDMPRLGSPPVQSKWKSPLHYVLWMCSGVFILLLGGFVHRFFFLGR